MMNKEDVINISRKFNETEARLLNRLEAYENFDTLEEPYFVPYVDFSTIKIEDTLCKHKKETNEYVICDLNDLEHSHLITKYFQKVIKNDENTYTALNGCIYNEGVFIYIKKDIKIKELLNISFKKNFGRCLIVLEEGSEANLIIKSLDNSFSNHVVEVVVLKNSKLNLINTLNTSFNYIIKRAVVSDFASMNFIDINLGEGNISNPSIFLNGSNSSGLIYSYSSCNSNLGGKVIHKNKNTSSKIYVCLNNDNSFKVNLNMFKNSLNSKANIFVETYGCNIILTPEIKVDNDTSSFEFKTHDSKEEIVLDNFLSQIEGITLLKNEI